MPSSTCHLRNKEQWENIERDSRVREQPNHTNSECEGSVRDQETNANEQEKRSCLIRKSRVSVKVSF
jgi:hypothetical protein